MALGEKRKKGKNKRRSRGRGGRKEETRQGGICVREEEKQERWGGEKREKRVSQERIDKQQQQRTTSGFDAWMEAENTKINAKNTHTKLEICMIMELKKCDDENSEKKGQNSFIMVIKKIIRTCS
jgi:hypothetical protein